MLHQPGQVLIHPLFWKTSEEGDFTAPQDSVVHCPALLAHSNGGGRGAGCLQQIWSLFMYEHGSRWLPASLVPRLQVVTLAVAAGQLLGLEWASLKLSGCIHVPCHCWDCNINKPLGVGK